MGDRYYTFILDLFAKALDSHQSPFLKAELLKLLLWRQCSSSAGFFLPQVLSVPNWCLFGKYWHLFPILCGNTNKSYWIFIMIHIHIYIQYYVQPWIKKIRSGCFPNMGVFLPFITHATCNIRKVVDTPFSITHKLKLKTFSCYNHSSGPPLSIFTAQSSGTVSVCPWLK